MPICTREEGRGFVPEVVKDGPSAPGPAWAPETSGQTKTRLATSTQPMRDGTNRGQALFMGFPPFLDIMTSDG
jgi:hypothetical protein